MKLTIYYGNAKPLTAIGKNQCRMLQFAYEYRQWHTCRKDRATQLALNALVRKGYLETIGNDMFKLRDSI